uniref:Cyanophycinase n=1 Tax=candidate division WOR-3 bacterium TaxID=2052148 RepID=A0A7V3ZX85_UNCW3
MIVIPMGGNISITTSFKISNFLKSKFNFEPSMLILPCASGDPKYFPEICEFWERAFKRVKLIPFHKKANTKYTESDWDKFLEDANFVFFSGGDQKRIIELVRDSYLHERLLERLKNDEDFAVGGTSAGAAVLGELCILRGSNTNFSSVRVTKGLNFISGFIVDQHFKERKRFGRLIYALDSFKLNGVGVDEDTALIYERNKGFTKILGNGYVWFFEYLGDKSLKLYFASENEEV